MIAATVGYQTKNLGKLQTPQNTPILFIHYSINYLIINLKVFGLNSIQFKFEYIKGPFNKILSFGLRLVQPEPFCARSVRKHLVR